MYKSLSPCPVMRRGCDGDRKDRAMSRRLALAWVLLTAFGSVSRAQFSAPESPLPTRAALARLGLERSWFGVVPLGYANERVLVVSLADDLLLAQTSLANLHVF